MRIFTSSRLYSVLSLAIIASAVSSAAPAQAVGLPTAITITKTAVNGGEVALAWKQSNVPNVHMYKIEIKNVTNPKSPAILLSTPINNIKYTHLDVNAKYEVRVRLTFGKFFYNWSQKKVFTTALGAPTGLQAGDVTDSTINLTWNPLSGVDGYDIYADGALVAKTTEPNIHLTKLEPGHTYKIAVTSVLKGVESVLSPSILVVTKTPVSTITSTVTNETITSTSIADIGTTSAKISWVSTTNAKSYIVKIFDSTGINEVKSYEISGELRSAVVTGLSPVSTYNYAITRNNADGSNWVTPLSTFSTVRNPSLGLVATAGSTTSVNLSWIPVAGAASYDLFRDGTLVANNIAATATSYTVSGLTPGYVYSFQLRVASYDANKNLVYSDNAISVSGTPFTDISFVPSINGAPYITLPYASVPIVGAVLTATTGIWKDPNQITYYGYQWQRSLDGGSTWNDIGGQTSSSYTVVASDYQYRLRVAVTARNNNGLATTYSTASSIVDAIYNIQIPIVRGQLIPGQVLEVTEGTWSSKYPMTYTYQWYKDGVAISGEQSTSHVLASTEIGSLISARVTAITSLGSLTVASAVRSAVTAIANTDLPVVTGVAKAYSTLSTTIGTWIGSPSGTTYQWQKSSDQVTWDSIAGATDQTYTLALSDVGYYIRSQVFETKTVSAIQYKVVASSIPTALITNLTITNTASPVLGGTWRTGQVLSVSSGSWSVAGTFTYQWQGSSNGSTWSDISGATANTFTITSAENGLMIRAKVQNVSGGATGFAFSNSTPKVGAPYNSVAPFITGVLQVGETQTLQVGTWTETATLTYVWQSSTDGIVWTTIAGATDSATVMTYALSNSRIRAVVTATNAVDTATATTAWIAGFAPPRVSVVPVVSGTKTVGQTLTATSGTWPNTVSGYEYQWQKSLDGGQSWISIAGAVASTYTLVSADAGYTIRVQVALTNTTGTSASYSLPTAVVAP